MDLDYDYILYRILTKYYYISVNNINYKIVAPNISYKYLAHTIYRDIINNNKYDTLWISQNGVDRLLEMYSIWNKQEENKLNQCKKLLDNSKIQYFLNYNTTSTREQIKNIIDNTNDSLTKLYNKKHHFDYLTLEYYAQSVKNQYLLSTMVYIDDVRTFSSNLDNLNIDLLEKIIPEIYKNFLGHKEIKKLARSEIWKTYWTAHKDNIFNGSVIDWTDEQRSLVNFTRTLDIVKEHMEAPTDEIIDDDDALDGWMLHQHEKIVKEKKEKHILDKYNLSDNKGQEIFILTQNQEEAKEIFSLNDPSVNRDIHEMKSIVNNNDKLVNWGELPHVKREILQQPKTQRN